MVNELLFDPTKHEYSVNGAILPSATQIIDFVLYPNEFKWVDDETLERASEFGRNVHKSLELDFPDPLNDEELHCYNEAVRILTENNIEIITKETRVYSKLGYAGTLDLYGKINGKRAIFDYKTGSTINHDKVAWQQSLYKNILEERGEVVEEIYAIHIPKNRKGKLIKLPPKHRIEIEWLIGEYERKIDRIMKEMDYRLRGEVEVNKDGTYPSYEQWIERILTTYRNPFDEKLLREFSVNELVRALEPRLRQKHKEEVEKKRLNDLKKEKENE